MFSCPNCGGNLKFDIPSQKMNCEFCSTKFDPYQFDSKSSDAQESKDFEVTIFTCPQCGGEILSTDNAAAGFCSFCGASTVLYSRISNEKRPGYIIPFSKTKQDCKQAYSDLMRRAIFAPKEFKDPAKIDSFRGIYMPYWSYYVTQKGPIKLRASRSHRRGDYIIHDNYELTGDLDAYYKGFSHDSSSSFDDNISQAIAPYDVKGMKSFTPAFFSGFYADTADVSPDAYKPQAFQLATIETSKNIRRHEDFSRYSLDSSLSASSLHTKLEQVDSAMFPVWFMSYRNGDRIAYATVNGQTGKVYSDLPVDKKKYVLGSLGLAIPIFALLCLFLTLRPVILLVLCGILGLISCVLYGTQHSAIKKQEGEIPTGRRRRLGIMCTLICIGAGAMVVFLKPVSDLYYYGAVLALLVSVLIMFTDIITYYNIRSTRRLPQFDKKGGDDRA